MDVVCYQIYSLLSLASRQTYRYSTCILSSSTDLQYSFSPRFLSWNVKMMFPSPTNLCIFYFNRFPFGTGWYSTQIMYKHSFQPSKAVVWIDDLQVITATALFVSIRLGSSLGLCPIPMQTFELEKKKRKKKSCAEKNLSLLLRLMLAVIFFFLNKVSKNFSSCLRGIKILPCCNMNLFHIYTFH